MGTLIVGYVLDLIFGDPHGMWHPICFIGNMISFFERRLQSDCVHEQVAKADCERPLYERIRGSKKEQKQKQLDTTNTNESKKDGCDKKRESEVFHEPNRELAGGVLLVICVLAVSTAIPLVILMICYRIWFWLGFAVQSYMCYTILATKSLKTESMKVAEVLQTDGLEAGRKAVSMIVGRDTQNLTETGVVKAAVETVAENTSDGILAPMFYMAIGGPVLGYFYKADTFLEANGVRVDTAERLVWKNEKPLDLPLVEYKLLCLFMQNPNHLMPREMILDRMWDGNGNFVDDNTLSVYIRRLRNKIEDTPNQPKYLLTERGIGYKWVVE